MYQVCLCMLKHSHTFHLSNTFSTSIIQHIFFVSCTANHFRYDKPAAELILRNRKSCGTDTCMGILPADGN